MKKRVVVTGLGMVSSLGKEKDVFWSNIKQGKNGISIVEKINDSDFSPKTGAEVKDFDPTEYIDRKEARRMDRYTQFAVAASDIAMNDSKIDKEKINSERMGVIVGSGIGGIKTFEDQHDVYNDKGFARVSPFFIPMMISNMSSGWVAIRHGAKGHNETIVTACATSTNSIGAAFRVIQNGYADVMITGGSEASLTKMAFAGFSSMKAISKSEDPNTASRPFDANRDGFVMGEGAAILIIEELEHAINRGAHIYCEIVGYASTCDAYHITAPAPNGEGAARCMALAVEDAGIDTNSIDYINAHGTSTVYNDKYETAAIKSVFGEHAKNIAVSSTKSMTGHLLGAAGAIESIICSLAIQDGIIPPTINYKNQDPECDLDYVPNTARKADINYAISNSFGFGGHNATIAFKKY